MKKTALLSVYEKKGIVDFAHNLVALGFDILASGGTAKELTQANIPVRDVSDLVGGGAILGHRVVTLSREVHAGLLARRIDVDIKELEDLGIPFIDLVCVDLYPMQEEINKPGSTVESVIEKTDIGGPTMLRSAAKGRRIVICDPDDRFRVIEWLKDGRPEETAFINDLAAKTEFTVANYCLWSAVFHGNGRYAGFMGERTYSCKYGENAYQSPADLYSNGGDDPLALNKFVVLEGSSLSYNNLCDIDRLLQTMTHIAAAFHNNYWGYIPRIAVAVKHGNACGAGLSENTKEVYAVKKMVVGDPLSIFGGLVMFNFTVTKEVAEVLLAQIEGGEKRLLDGIVAPQFNDEAVEMLRRKAGKCKMVINKALMQLHIYGKSMLDNSRRTRWVRGGFLVQPNYTFIPNIGACEKIGQASHNDEEDMLLAKAICDTSNSNTITIVKDGCLLANAVGQQARVRGAMLAVNLAGYSNHSLQGAIAASDSFFPFIDGVEVLYKAGIKAIIGTVGSVNDNKVLDYCKENDIIFYYTKDAEGRGFFGH